MSKDRQSVFERIVLRAAKHDSFSDKLRETFIMDLDGTSPHPPLVISSELVQDCLGELYEQPKYPMQGWTLMGWVFLVRLRSSGGAWEELSDVVKQFEKSPAAQACLSVVWEWRKTTSQVNFSQDSINKYWSDYGDILSKLQADFTHYLKDREGRTLVALLTNPGGPLQLSTTPARDGGNASKALELCRVLLDSLSRSSAWSVIIRVLQVDSRCMDDVLPILFDNACSLISENNAQKALDMWNVLTPESSTSTSTSVPSATPSSPSSSLSPWCLRTAARPVVFTRLQGIVGACVANLERHRDTPTPMNCPARELLRKSLEAGPTQTVADLARECLRKLDLIEAEPVSRDKKAHQLASVLSVASALCEVYGRLGLDATPCSAPSSTHLSPFSLQGSAVVLRLIEVLCAHFSRPEARIFGSFSRRSIVKCWHNSHFLISAATWVPNLLFRTESQVTTLQRVEDLAVCCALTDPWSQDALDVFYRAIFSYVSRLLEREFSTGNGDALVSSVRQLINRLLTSFSYNSRTKQQASKVLLICVSVFHLLLNMPDEGLVGTQKTSSSSQATDRRKIPWQGVSLLEADVLNDHFTVVSDVSLSGAKVSWISDSYLSGVLQLFANHVVARYGLNDSQRQRLNELSTCVVLRLGALEAMDDVYHADQVFRHNLSEILADHRIVPGSLVLEYMAPFGFHNPQVKVDIKTLHGLYLDENVETVMNSFGEFPSYVPKQHEKRT